MPEPEGNQEVSINAGDKLACSSCNQVLYEAAVNMPPFYEPNAQDFKSVRNDVADPVTGDRITCPLCDANFGFVSHFLIKVES